MLSGRIAHRLPTPHHSHLLLGCGLPKHTGQLQRATTQLGTGVQDWTGWSVYIPSRKLTYPTWGKGKSSSKVPFWGDMLVPWRVYPPFWKLIISPKTLTVGRWHFRFPPKQGEPENPKDKPDTRKPIFNVRLMLRVHFVIWVTISTWEPKRTSSGNLPPSLSRIRLSCIQLIRLLFFSNRHHTLKNRQSTQK